MNNESNLCDSFVTPTIVIARHNKVMGRPECYRVITVNIELARMQGVPVGEVHFNAVVDDFGNLVRVA